MSTIGLHVTRSTIEVKSVVFTSIRHGVGGTTLAAGPIPGSYLGLNLLWQFQAEIDVLRQRPLVVSTSTIAPPVVSR